MTVTVAGDQLAAFPPTRYQGSKRKLLPALAPVFEGLDFDTALDAFGGTGAVSYLLKSMGKRVTYNDAYRFNHKIGRALVANAATRLPQDEASALLRRTKGRTYRRVVTRNFDGAFFPAAENRWIDVVAQNILAMQAGFRRDIAHFALFQACLVKRPYNLFHRANLAMRTREVERSFGNKATWETPFETHFLRLVDEVNAAVFSNGRRNRATRHDALAHPGRAFDLVYIDPPYVNARGVGVDYLDFYHFLEGLCCYEAWESMIDRTRKHRPMRAGPNPWCGRHTIGAAFDQLLDRFRASHLVVSYRADGIPSLRALEATFRRHGRSVRRRVLRPYQYALSKRSATREVVLVSERP